MSNRHLIDKKSTNVMWTWFFGWVGVMGVFIIIWIFASMAEARAYERVTGHKVSTLDAMFLQLRVQEGTAE